MQKKFFLILKYFSYFSLKTPVYPGFQGFPGLPWFSRFSRSSGNPDQVIFQFPLCSLYGVTWILAPFKSHEKNVTVVGGTTWNLVLTAFVPQPIHTFVLSLIPSSHTIVGCTFSVHDRSNLWTCVTIPCAVLTSVVLIHLWRHFAVIP